MLGAPLQCLQNQHVERALKQLDPVLIGSPLFLGCGHRCSHSTPICRRVSTAYRSLLSVMEGGASPGALPQLRFGLSPISRTSVPPPAISACENHGLSSGLPLSWAD